MNARLLTGDELADAHNAQVLGLEDSGAGVEPADLQQVGQQRLEAVELLLQQLGGATGHRVEERLGVVDDVAGHPHGGDGGAQLVGDVGDEAALQRLKRGGHVPAPTATRP